MFLMTPRLRLRPVAPDDHDAMCRVLGDPEVMRFSEGVLNAAQVRDWLTHWIALEDDARCLGMWAVEAHGSSEALGYGVLSRFPERCEAGEAELGFRLRRDAWGRGYATEYGRALCRFGLQVPGIDHIVAIVDPHHAVSIRVLEKFGMHYLRDFRLPHYSHADHVYVTSCSPR